jgi:hypothetical protein
MSHGRPAASDAPYWFATLLANNVFRMSSSALMLRELKHCFLVKDLIQFDNPSTDGFFVHRHALIAHANARPTEGQYSCPHQGFENSQDAEVRQQVRFRHGATRAAVTAPTSTMRAA